MSYQNLIVETRDGIAIVTINRPDKLNALNDRTVDELDAAFAAIGADAAVRGVILTGAGEKAFVAGADIAELATQSPVDGKERSIRGQQVLDRIERPRQARDRGRERLRARRRLRAGHGLPRPHRLRERAAGHARGEARHHVRLRGHAAAAAARGQGPRPGDAAHGRDGGRGGSAAHRPREPRRAEARSCWRRRKALLRKMLANGPVSLRFTLEAVNAGLEMPLAEAQHQEATLFGLICTTEDMKEGTKAFLEKRPARFQGK